MTFVNPNTDFSDYQLEELVGQCDRTPPVPDHAFVDRLRATLLHETQAEPAMAPARRTTPRSFARYLVAASVAATVLWALLIRTPSSWAQVQEALSSRPWIHLRAKLDDGKVRDNWISIPQQKSAFCVGPTAQYIDLRGDLQFDYDESRGTVVRAPHRSIQSSESMFALFQQLVQGKQPIVDEVEHAKVIDTRSRTVIETGKEWLDVEMTLQYNAHDPVIKSLARLEFRVDPATKLPKTMTLSILDGGANYPADAQRRLVYQIDYPDEGPADIYALGIPRDAKLDDRVPSDDTSLALKAIAAGRRDFDPYYAIVFHADKSSDQPFNAFPSTVVWRRGNQVRVEVCMPFEEYTPYSEKPAGTSDLTWWKQQLKHFHFLPRVVCDGKTSYRAEIGPPDAQGKRRVSSWIPLASIRKGEFLSDDLHISPERGRMPEFYAYPLVESSDITTVQLEPAATPELPRGSLLTYSVTVPHPNAYHRTRIWLDGDRGYVATRKILDHLEGPGGQGDGLSAAESREDSICVEDQHSMRNFERSPKGFWYPTLVIRESRINDPKKADGAPEVHYLSTSFLLDFDAEMPNSFFTTKERKSP